jgi:hypothetical protein
MRRGSSQSAKYRRRTKIVVEILEDVAIREAFEDRIALTGRATRSGDNFDRRLCGNACDIFSGGRTDNGPVRQPRLAPEFGDCLGEQVQSSHGQKADGDTQQHFL